MGYGFECTKCGGQESAHFFPKDYPGVCDRYRSPDKMGEALLRQAEADAEIATAIRRAGGEL